jgi:hypothetical protein
VKKRVLSALTVLLLLLSLPAAAQLSPYAGQQDRPIKALSDEEILSYLNGEGPGYDKAAELNRYPGPREVLDLATQLGLTEPQKQRVQSIYDEMHEKAARLGKEIVSHEAVLDSLFGNRIVDSAGLHSMVGEIARLQGELRATNLEAHLAVTRILAPDQILAYDRLRGYDGSVRVPGDHHE